VAPTRSDVTSGARVTLARVLGVLSSLVALALAGLAAVSLNDLAQRDVAS